MLTDIKERRKSERFAVKTAVRVLLPQGQAPIDCVATDISDGGAQLNLRAADLPDVFVLHFIESGRRRHCRVAWRQGATTGIAFTDRTQVNFGRRIAAR